MYSLFLKAEPGGEGAVLSKHKPQDVLEVASAIFSDYYVVLMLLTLGLFKKHL